MQRGKHGRRARRAATQPGATTRKGRLLARAPGHAGQQQRRAERHAEPRAHARPKASRQAA
eukprot:4130434-Lingulodinium_polyedra.AAC.1